MKYYLDITLLSGAEADLGFLWQKVYQQTHIALVENKTENDKSAIAVSFPEYESKIFPLGSKLRLLAQTQEQLRKLDINKWLNRLSDYTHCTSIKEVPPSVFQFACFKRGQFNTNIERLARRRVKRKAETIEQALKHYSGFNEQMSKLPFVNVNSLSKEQKFRLFIERKISEQSVDGSFSCYGLSKTATVPWF